MIDPSLIFVVVKGFYAQYKIYIILALIASYSAFVFYLGGIGPRATRDLLQQRVESAEEVFELVEEEHEEDRNELIARKDKELEDDKTQLTESWNTFIASLPTAADVDAAHARGVRDGRTRAAQESVPVDASICDDPGANQRLSDAVSGYLEESRQIRGRERAETAGLLKTCEAQTGQLINLQETWKEEVRVNRYRTDALHP